MDQEPARSIRDAIPRAFVYFLLFWGLPGIVGIVIYGRELRHDEERARLMSRHLVNLCASRMERTLDAARSDLLFLARQEILHSFWDEPRGKEVLENEYASFADERDCYHHIRLLSVDGRELVRVNMEEGHPVVAPETTLQSKVSRYYVPATRALEPGDVYVSEFDLNVEHGSIEEPWRPVLRLSTPVVDTLGTIRGLLVLNLDGALLLSELAELGLRTAGSTMLLNQSGSYLSGVPPARRWGLRFGHDEFNLAVDHPRVWAQIAAEPTGQIRNGHGFITFATIGEGDSALTIVSNVPFEVARDGAKRLFDRFFWFAIATSIPLFVLSTYLARARQTRVRQQQAIADSERRLRSLSGRLFALQEQERKSISRDLHDELGQLVTAIAIELRGAAKMASGSIGGHIQRAEKAASLLLRELHDVVARLRPTILDDLGLGEALRSHARTFERTSGSTLELRLEPSAHEIPARVGETVYRIVQEALTNTAKHARSDRVSLSMVVTEGHLNVEIADNGVGFDPRATEPDRFGLLGMRERAALLGGTLTLSTRPGGGTRITAEIPLAPPPGPMDLHP